MNAGVFNKGRDHIMGTTFTVPRSNGKLFLRVFEVSYLGNNSYQY